METQQTLLLTPDMEFRADQNVDAIKVQLGEWLSFTGVTYGVKDKGLLTGRKMNQSPPNMGDISET